MERSIIDRQRSFTKYKENRKMVTMCTFSGKEVKDGEKACEFCEGKVKMQGGVQEQEMMTVQLPGGVPLELMRVEAGSFIIGSPEDEPMRKSSETQRNVTISHDFWLGKYAVTQAQWQAVMGGNPSKFNYGGDYPVEYVNAEDAMAFCEQLNQSGLAPNGFRFDLPTEEQWEYAARGGRRSQGFVYSGSNNLHEVAWYDENSDGKPHPVGEKAPNELGLFDMSGNVNEWCRDRKEGALGPMRLLKGGAWRRNARFCRSASRNWIMPSFRAGYLGFRLPLVRVP